MPIVGRSMWWMGCWSRYGLNFQTHEVNVDYPGTVSIATGMTWSGYWEEEGSGFARVGIDYVRYRNGSQETFFLEPVLFRSNVSKVGWRCEVAHARVRGTIMIDFWS
jgi:hypothetical protein